MNHIKIFEKFDEVNEICLKLGLTNFNINDDDTVDVRGDVHFYSRLFGKIPIKFGHVSGDFYISKCGLVSLEGSPKTVGGDFVCGYNRLSDLRFSPSFVGGSFSCKSNYLSTLIGAPDKIGGDFDCSDNSIYSMDGLPENIGGEIYCSYNNIFGIYRLFPDKKSFLDSLDWDYLRVNGNSRSIIKSRFEEACDEAGIKMPWRIMGYKYI